MGLQPCFLRPSKAIAAFLDQSTVNKMDSRRPGIELNAAGIYTDLEIRVGLSLNYLAPSP